jgi:hypothetical protein
MNKSTIGQVVIECIECGVKSTFKGQLSLGQEVMCPECATWMEVVSLDPIEVDWIYEEPESDDDDEDW